jgi:hypothetical protein
MLFLQSQNNWSKKWKVNFLGTLAMAGPVVTVLVSALEGAVVVGGLSALGCAMLELGVDHSNAITKIT